MVTASLLLLAAAGPTVAQDTPLNQRIDAVLGDHAAYERVILSTRKAVAARDAPALAALVRYPIKVEIRGQQRTIRAPGAFVANYDGIITSAIARAVTAGAYDDLFVRDQGVMLGDGQMWIAGVCRDAACKAKRVQIITIQPG